ncbi:Helicase associated domain protein [Streptomyces sp. NPDC088400]|uniref:Helicase associated domain protein n=1 Tax=Streptomyces sp. NPDC088400 TaxID=3365861 RepID=UPI00382C55DA
MSSAISQSSLPSCRCRRRITLPRTVDFPEPQEPIKARTPVSVWARTRPQWDLLGALPLNHPLAYLLRRPRRASQHAFSRGLHSAYLFWRRHEHLDVPHGYTHEQNGYSLHLGRWIAARRQHVAQLRAEELAALEALDMRWIPHPGSPGPFLLKTSRLQTH